MDEDGGVRGDEGRDVPDCATKGLIPYPGSKRAFLPIPHGIFREIAVGIVQGDAGTLDSAIMHATRKIVEGSGNVAEISRIYGTITGKAGSTDGGTRHRA
ncbi:MAG: hypothetical protein NT080_12585 [Spirochaetes bacterium]|nr:hypothetical protein [Spirochaetota bacterium]